MEALMDVGTIHLTDFAWDTAFRNLEGVASIQTPYNLAVLLL